MLIAFDVYILEQAVYLVQLLHFLVLFTRWVFGWSGTGGIRGEGYWSAGAPLNGMGGL